MTDISLRFALFLMLLTSLGAAERFWPRHAGPARRLTRWPVNLGLGTIDAVCLRLLMPLLAVEAAVWAGANHVGALHLMHLRPLTAAVIAFVAMDLAMYAQHRLMHRVGLLWRLHRVHHTDLALDVTSGVRFHPLEILLSMGIKILALVVLGAAPAVVFVFEIVLSSFSLVTHANLALPTRVDRALRYVFVTPDMHRIHHSVLREEHDTNFGFHVSWWDRFFGSYRTQPRQSQASMDIGLDAFRSDAEQRLGALLRQPLHPS